MVRPSRSFSDLSVPSVKKKLKDKSFCAPVDRGELERGAKDLGLPFDKHIQNVIRFLEPVEKELGLGEPKPAKAKKG